MIGIYLIIPDYISVPVKKTHVNCLLLPREHRFFAIAACDHLLGGQEHPEKNNSPHEKLRSIHLYCQYGQCVSYSSIIFPLYPNCTLKRIDLLCIG